MMKSKGFNFLCLFYHKSLQSNNCKGKISINENFGSKNEVSIYEKSKGLIFNVLPNTTFEFKTNLNKLELIFIAEGYPTVRKNIDFLEMVISF